MNIELKLKTPRTPNFIIVEDGKIIKRQNGFTDSTSIHIKDLSDEQLSEIADEWKVNLLENARRLRESK